MNDIRPSPIAGTWYPGDPVRLERSIDLQLRDVVLPPLRGRVVGVIAPHAGHQYSGYVAAHAFEALADRDPEIVAILSPLHTPYAGEVFTTGHSAYVTPLGEVPVNHDLVDLFENELQGEVELQRIRNDQEHSLEIELPFLQCVLQRPFTLLPIMILMQNEAISHAIGTALGKTLQGRNAVIVASSDLSHFYPASTAEVLDGELLKRIETFDPQGVIAAEKEGVGFACGRGAIAAAMWGAKLLGADQAQVLAYAHSGAVTGDLHSVVGYGAAVLLDTTSS